MPLACWIARSLSSAARTSTCSALLVRMLHHHLIAQSLCIDVVIHGVDAAGAGPFFDVTDAIAPVGGGREAFLAGSLGDEDCLLGGVTLAFLVALLAEPS